MTIRFGPQACGRLDEAAAREWLVSDGVGGYAMGTVAGLRTRRYHGLLVPATGGPSARMLGLVALEPVLVVGDARFELATDEWSGGEISPRGNELLVTFDLEDGVPRWRWQVADIVLEREVALAYGKSAVSVVHRLVHADRPVRLELTPLCTWRSVHGERFANGDPSVEPTTDGFVFEGAFRVAGPGYEPGGEWYRGVRAREEAARGLNDVEDVWAAGTFAVELAPGQSTEVIAAATPFDDLPPASSIVPAARARAASLVKAAGAAGEIDAALVLAADQFAITTAGRPTAVAGYPWFGEWSRDLMTSYEGLYLSTNRVAEGREVLRTSAATVSEGMLANTADTGSLEYNTVDGTLWFVHALDRHIASTGDDDLGGRARAGRSSRIVHHHLEGTLIRDRARTRRRAAPAGRRRLGADLDGRPDRRRSRPTPRPASPSRLNALRVEALRVAAGLRSFSAATDRLARIARIARRPRSSRAVRPPRRPRAARRRGRPRRGRRHGPAEPAPRCSLAALATPLGRRRSGRRPRPPARRSMPAGSLAHPARAPLARPRRARRYRPSPPAETRPPSATRPTTRGTVWPWLMRPRTSTPPAVVGSPGGAASWPASTRTSATGRSAPAPSRPTAPHPHAATGLPVPGLVGGGGAAGSPQPRRRGAAPKKTRRPARARA